MSSIFRNWSRPKYRRGPVVSLNGRKARDYKCDPVVKLNAHADTYDASNPAALLARIAERRRQTIADIARANAECEAVGDGRLQERLDEITYTYD